MNPGDRGSQTVEPGDLGFMDLHPGLHHYIAYHSTLPVPGVHCSDLLLRPRGPQTQASASKQG